jgi:hypothetical protein
MVHTHENISFPLQIFHFLILFREFYEYRDTYLSDEIFVQLLQCIYFFIQFELGPVYLSIRAASKFLVKFKIF